MVKILTGDARIVIPTLPDCSVNCCVTSPPYWGLRDYGCVGQIGLEQSPENYVAEMVAVFREVKRVLKDDGTLWLNLGDSYARMQEGNVPNGKTPDCVPAFMAGRVKNAGLKPKDLVGIPWRVAFALQADGWYLRQDIIWSKPNPMPESVTDRCTKSHEYIFLLSKSAKYYYDAAAIAEPVTQSSIDRLSQPNLEQQAGSNRVPGKTNGPMKAVGAGRKSWKGSAFHDGKNAENHPNVGRNRESPFIHGNRPGRDDEGRACNNPEQETRNKRSVWTVTTQPYKEAHFATFPPALIRPCILAGCPVGGTVLDPFGGSGTTGEVAEMEGRNSILIELNPKYVKLAEKRTAQGGLFCDNRELFSSTTTQGETHE